MRTMMVVMVSAVVLSACPTAFAHETRFLDAQGESTDAASAIYRLVVGFRNEPALEDVPNALDLRVYYNDGTSDQEAVNTRLGDVLQFTKLQALLLDNDTPHAKVLSRADLVPPTQPAFGETNRYVAYFVPTAEAPYGFQIDACMQNTVHQADTDNGGLADNAPQVGPAVCFSQRFICKGGSLNPPSSFNCASSPVPLPGPIERRYRHNRIGTISPTP